MTGNHGVTWTSTTSTYWTYLRCVMNHTRRLNINHLITSTLFFTLFITSGFSLILEKRTPIPHTLTSSLSEGSRWATSDSKVTKQKLKLSAVGRAPAGHTDKPDHHTRDTGPSRWPPSLVCSYSPSLPPPPRGLFTVVAALLRWVSQEQMWAQNVCWEIPLPFFW